MLTRHSPAICYLGSQDGESQRSRNCLTQNKMLSAGVDKCEHISIYADMLHCMCVCVRTWCNLSWRSFEEQSFRTCSHYTLVSLHFGVPSAVLCRAVPRMCHTESKRLTSFLPGHCSLHKPSMSSPTLTPSSDSLWGTHTSKLLAHTEIQETHTHIYTHSDTCTKNILFCLVIMIDAHPKTLRSKTNGGRLHKSIGWEGRH